MRHNIKYYAIVNFCKQTHLYYILIGKGIDNYMIHTLIKKTIITCIFLSSCFGEHGSSGNATGKTSFSDVLLFNPACPYRTTLFNYLKPTDSAFSVSVIGSYSKSCSNHLLSEYFLLDGRNTITVLGGADNFEFSPQSKYRRDIDAVNFGVVDDDFHSAVELQVQSEMGTVSFYGEQIFNYHDNGSPRWSMQLSFPIILLKNSISGEESILKKDINNFFVFSQSPSLDFLSSEDLLYSRWYINENKKNTFASHLEWNLSYNSMYGDIVSAETYGGMLIPLTDNAKDPYFKYRPYIFAPMITNSSHWGLHYGTKLHIESKKTDTYSLEFIIAANSVYLFPGTEYRTFDLRHKPWSRYMQCYTDFGTPSQEGTALTNELTLKCTVHPLFSFTSTAEIVFRNNLLNLSFGYSLYARAAEYLEIIDTPPQLVLASSSPDVAKNIINPVHSMGLRLEKEDFAVTPGVSTSDLQYYASLIRPFDIDKDSAAHPGVMTGIFYAKGWLLQQEDSINSLGLGLSYNLSNHNTVIQRATIWVWGSIEF